MRADESELQHALINLVLNAVQACEPGGCVSLSALGGNPIRLRVVDDGCGIPSEDSKRVFEPFVSLRKGGTGLGLFLSLNFVRRWGGDIAIESEPGTGIDLRGQSPERERRPRCGDRLVSARASLLLVDDDAAFRSVMARELSRLGFEVATAESGAEALRHVGEEEPGVVLLDLRLPDQDGLQVLDAIRRTSPAVDVIMLTGHGSIDTAIESIRMGRLRLHRQAVPARRARGPDRACPRAPVAPACARASSSAASRRLTSPAPSSGRALPTEGSFELIERVAASESTVLIAGETGTGKEMVAKLLHARSPRRDRPFVVVECATLQESLLQSELFGHERGAFTGAERAKAGLFEVADGGTIFLDEIGEISQATQVNLLRVLDASTFRHVGGTREIRVDVRVLAATNRKLPGDGPAGALPGGPLLSTEHDHRRGAAAAGAAGRRRPAGRALRRAS